MNCRMSEACSCLAAQQPSLQPRHLSRSDLVNTAWMKGSPPSMQKLSSQSRLQQVIVHIDCTTMESHDGPLVRLKTL